MCWTLDSPLDSSRRLCEARSNLSNLSWRTFEQNINNRLKTGKISSLSLAHTLDWLCLEMESVMNYLYWIVWVVGLVATRITRWWIIVVRELRCFAVTDLPLELGTRAKPLRYATFDKTRSTAKWCRLFDLRHYSSAAAKYAYLRKNEIKEEKIKISEFQFSIVVRSLLMQCV